MPPIDTMSRRSSSARTEVDKDLVVWARKNLNHLPKDAANYERMISGLPYDANCDSFLRHRLTSHEHLLDYKNIRLKDFATLEEYHAARTQHLKQVLGQVGENCFIEQNIFCDYGCNVKLGKNFYANNNVTFLDCSVIEIGDYVLLGPNVTITTATHPLEAQLRLEGVEFAMKVTIGNNVWIGSNVVILPGVTIGDNSIVAAGAIVSKDVPPSVVVGGIPAKVIKEVPSSK